MVSNALKINDVLSIYRSAYTDRKSLGEGQGHTFTVGSYGCNLFRGAIGWYKQFEIHCRGRLLCNLQDGCRAK